MKNSRTRCGRARHCVLIACVSLLLYGCIDIDIAIAIRRDETVRLDIAYRIDEDLAALGSFQPQQLRSLPLRKIDFLTIIADHPGVRLQRYRDTRRGGERRITARIRFASLSAFNAFFAADAAHSVADAARSVADATHSVADAAHPALQITQDEQGGGGELLFPLASAAVSQDAATARLMQQFYHEFFAENIVSVRVTAPRRITTVSGGERRGRRAYARHSLAELAVADGDILWRVAW